MIDADPMGKWPNKGSPSHRPILALRSPLLACSSDDDSGCVMDDLYAWVPPRVKPQLVHAYFGALPAEKVPRIGTAGEQWRRRQLERQLPPQDADARFCGNLSQAEERQLAAFARTRQQHSLGRASVQQLPPRLAQTADGSAAKLYCHQCKCPIGADGLAVVARAHFGQRAFWHPHCFMCVECQELLVDLIYFEHAHNVFCGRHHAELVKPRCANCDELIFSEECTEAEGRVWHMKHFCCARCGLQLGGRRYVTRPDDSQPVCVACCREGDSLPVCSTCRKEIVAELPHIAQSDWHWHADERCFCCSVCERALLGKTYSLSNGRLFCGMQICKCKAQSQPSTPVSPSPLPAPAAFPALPARVRFDLSRQILRPPPLPKRSPPPAPTANKASTPPENVYETVAAFPSGAATMTTTSTSSGCSVNGSMSSGGGVNSPQCIYYQQRQRQMLLNRHHKYPPFPIPREPKNEMHKCSSTEDEAPKRSLSEDGRGRRVRKKHKGGQGPLGQRNPGPGPDRGLAAALSLATSRGRRRTRERGRRRKQLPWLDDHSWSSSSSSGLSPSSSSSSSSSESRERVCQRAFVRRYVAAAAQANFVGSPSSGQNAARGPLGDGMGMRLATTRTTGAAAMPGLKVAKKKKQRQQSSCRIS